MKKESKAEQKILKESGVRRGIEKKAEVSRTKRRRTAKQSRECEGKESRAKDS